MSRQSTLRIAAAQSHCVPGDLAANLAIHRQFIAAASTAAVDLLVFPELSLSGYELPRLGHCIVHPEDELLSPIRDLARSAAMTIVVGAPMAGNLQLPCIGAIVFFPDGRTAAYRKQHLHPGEEKFVAQGTLPPQSYRFREETFALAICADTAHEEHAQDAAVGGASLFLAGVLVSERGYPTDSGNLRRYASTYGFAVVMANHGGPSGGYLSAGRSAIWAPGGKLVAVAPGTGNHLVIATRKSAAWSGESLAVETQAIPHATH